MKFKIKTISFYFEKELPKIQEGFKIEQNEREENDNANLTKLNEEIKHATEPVLKLMPNFHNLT